MFYYLGGKYVPLLSILMYGLQSAAAIWWSAEAMALTNCAQTTHSVWLSHTQAHIHMHIAEFWIVYLNDAKVQHPCSCLFIFRSPLSYTGFARGLWGSGLNLLSVKMPGKKSQSSYFWMFPRIYVNRARSVGQNHFQGVLHEEHAPTVHLTCATRPITCWPKPSFHILIGS